MCKARAMVSTASASWKGWLAHEVVERIGRGRVDAFGTRLVIQERAALRVALRRANNGAGSIAGSGAGNAAGSGAGSDVF